MTLIHELTTILTAIEPLHPKAFEVMENPNASRADLVRAVVEMRDIADLTAKLTDAAHEIAPVPGQGADVEVFCL